MPAPPRWLLAVPDAIRQLEKLDRDLLTRRDVGRATPARLDPCPRVPHGLESVAEESHRRTTSPGPSLDSDCCDRLTFAVSVPGVGASAGRGFVRLYGSLRAPDGGVPQVLAVRGEAAWRRREQRGLSRRPAAFESTRVMSLFTVKQVGFDGTLVVGAAHAVAADGW